MIDKFWPYRKDNTIILARETVDKENNKCFEIMYPTGRKRKMQEHSFNKNSFIITRDEINLIKRFIEEFDN